MRRIALAIVFILIALNCTPKKNQERLLIGHQIKHPIEDADPIIREPRSFKIPTKLLVNREISSIGITIDPSSLVDTVLNVGYKMQTGFRYEKFIISGGTRTHIGGGLSSNKEAKLGTSYINRTNDGIPNVGEFYLIELEIEIFETDIPAQHMWSPASSKYKVLWIDTLRSTQI